jgi:hypothetical protein
VPHERTNVAKKKVRSERTESPGLPARRVLSLCRPSTPLLGVELEAWSVIGAS